MGGGELCGIWYKCKYNLPYHLHHIYILFHCSRWTVNMLKGTFLPFVIIMTHMNIHQIPTHTKPIKKLLVNYTNQVEKSSSTPSIKKCVGEGKRSYFLGMKRAQHKRNPLTLFCKILSVSLFSLSFFFVLQRVLHTLNIITTSPTFPLLLL